MQRALRPKPVAAMLLRVRESFPAANGAVLDQSGSYASLLPEKQEGRLFQVVQKLIICNRRRGMRRIGHRAATGADYRSQYGKGQRGLAQRGQHLTAGQQECT